MLFMKVMIALNEDKLEESVVNAGRRYKFVINYQVLSNKHGFFPNNVDQLAYPPLNRPNFIIILMLK